VRSLSWCGALFQFSHNQQDAADDIGEQEEPPRQPLPKLDAILLFLNFIHDRKAKVVQLTFGS